MTNYYMLSGMTILTHSCLLYTYRLQS